MYFDNVCSGGSNFQNFRIEENNLFHHSTHSQPGLSAFIYQPLVPNRFQPTVCAGSQCAVNHFHHISSALPPSWKVF